MMQIPELLNARSALAQEARAYKLLGEALEDALDVDDNSRSLCKEIHRSHRFAVQTLIAMLAERGMKTAEPEYDEDGGCCLTISW